jgi:adenine-specific DNA-methyltransferase
MPNLNWDSRNAAVHAHTQTPYHLLQHVGNYGAPPSQGSQAPSEAQNLLIQGDNLQALKALLPFYTGRVKCVFIDPPYNTGSAFTHYDDKLQHSVWLSMMLPRIKLLHQLLAQDGSLWVTIDDNEAHYLKLMLDEVFGRENFVANVVWQKFHSVKTNAAYRLSDAHDHILIYKKSQHLQAFNFLTMDDEALKVYKNPDGDNRGLWRTAPLTVSLLGGARGAAFAKSGVSTGFYEIVSPTGKVHLPNKGRCWISRNGYETLLADGRIWWGKDGNAVPMKKVFLEESGGKKVSSTFWTHNEVGSNKAANEEQRLLYGEDEVFSTPKPERLLERILHLATNPNDLVLDSFLGSGTTAAVAHKMGRRWIGIEMGPHAATHCIPRLEKVIAGEQGGISSAVGWAGGGGFAHYTLGEPVFMANRHINPQVKFAALAAFVWHRETQQAANTTHTAPLLGVHEGTAYYLLYNGILRDRSLDGGNVLTRSLWDWLQTHHAPSEMVTRCVVYGEICKLAAPLCAKLGIVFKQMPYRLQDA